MSDVNPEQDPDSVIHDEAQPADAGWAADEERPEEAHGGSMAPGLVDDTGDRTSEARGLEAEG
ncbi:hypothetical protein [Actinoplanes siamensis]|uniref:Uncharacterized protein n=1 Tax=Actinoplanes siamensis TaxID=1223317 RepID=A0A919KBB9_9ACTN|nr:hypothetical protein [Actinoplanes siamensis]GIF03023.1 hypothetical protein Asi03nite_05610 [Actinoplanes siamensis]